MKFYEFIEALRKINPDKIVMIKSGAFFNSIGRDAIILEYTLGLKRTCFAKGLCKVGIPVAQFKGKIEDIKKRLKDKNLGIIIFDEVKDGKYKYNDKNYDVILELQGGKIEETRNNINCSLCKNNIYTKEINMYKIKEEDYEKLAINFEKFLENIKSILK